jgi:hypothetical protein
MHFTMPKFNDGALDQLIELYQNEASLWNMTDVNHVNAFARGLALSPTLCQFNGRYGLQI